MDQMNLLWAYQAEDMKAERLATEIRRNPLRQRMENDRTQYMERQKQHKQIEDQVSMLTDRKDAIRDALAHSQEQLRGLQARYDAAPPSDLDSIRSMIAEVSRCSETINRYEQELRSISGKVRDFDQRASSIRNEAMRLRSEFEKLKAQYEEQIPPKKAALDAQRAAAESKKEELPPELLARYNDIKKRVSPPLARLNGDQCSGCNTFLPSAVLHKVRSEGMVECESCSRLIIQL